MIEDKNSQSVQKYLLINSRKKQICFPFFNEFSMFETGKNTISIDKVDSLFTKATTIRYNGIIIFLF